ncbi:CPBP family intramembrane glutamic endopeptidase [Natrarchaeobaculum aegyptiacum]|nr:type II CAAX endopeptidase family protein [Natrarchaeobaculum aegyptiacum]
MPSPHDDPPRDDDREPGWPRTGGDDRDVDDRDHDHDRARADGSYDESTQPGAPAETPPGGDPHGTDPGHDGPGEDDDRPPLHERSRLAAFLGATGYVVGVFAFSMAVFLLLSFALLPFAFVADDPMTFFESIERVLIFVDPVVMGVGTAILAAISFWRGWVPRRAVGFSVPNAREVLVVVGGVIGLLALGLVTSVVPEYFGVPPSEHALMLEEGSVQFYVGLAVLSILVIGPVEEVLFRGLIQNYLRPAYGTAGTVVVTSILFAAVHLFAYSMQAPPLETVLVSLAGIFVLSLVLGGIYERYRNIVVVSAIHGFYNAVLFLSLIWA